MFHLGAGAKDLLMGKYPPIPAEAVLAVPYGATLRRDGGKWLRCRRVGAEPDAVVGEAETPDGAEISGSNQHFAQDGSAQALTPADVDELKERCSGEQVVEALALNSSTFATKTKFSQEKYLRKKRQKHLQQVTLLRPTIMELCETYMKQSRNKICGLRWDYLSSVLCQADVRSGGRFFVLDCACGLVVAAMAQQLAGSGRIYRVYRGGCPDKALQELDLGESRATVRQLPLEVLQSSDPSSHEWLRLPAEDPAQAGAAPHAVEEGEEAPVPPDIEGEEARARREFRAGKVRQRCADVKELEALGVDAVIIVAGEEEAELSVEALEVGLSRLNPGGRLVVYGQHLQPLAARQGSMRTGGGFVDVRLMQLFTREYQVLPQRTHPHMVADAQICEGFVLAASKVVADGAAPSEEGAVSTGAEKRRRKR